MLSAKAPLAAISDLLAHQHLGKTKVCLFLVLLLPRTVAGREHGVCLGGM